MHSCEAGYPSPDQEEHNARQGVLFIRGAVGLQTVAHELEKARRSKQLSRDEAEQPAPILF